jgi:hypothetical protein
VRPTSKEIIGIVLLIKNREVIMGQDLNHWDFELTLGIQRMDVKCEDISGYPRLSSET